MRVYQWIAFLVMNACVTCFVHADQTYTCTDGEKERVIAVVYDNQANKLPCEVQYYKDAGAMKVWRSTSVAGYCEEKAQTLVKQQLDFGWHCVSQTHGRQADNDNPPVPTPNTVKQ